MRLPAPERAGAALPLLPTPEALAGINRGLPGLFAPLFFGGGALPSRRLGPMAERRGLFACPGGLGRLSSPSGVRVRES